MSNPRTINLVTHSGGEIYETSGAIPLGHIMDQEYCIPGTDNARSTSSVYRLRTGQHIDLAHLICVDPAYFSDRMGSGGYFFGFNMYFQLMDNPVRIELEESELMALRPSLPPYCGRMASDDHVSWCETEGLSVMQDMVDEVVVSWKGYRS